MKRSSSIVFAVIVAVGLSLGAAGVSTVAPRDPGPGPGPDTIEPIPPGRNNPPSAPVNTRVEGGATGDGPADDARCEEFARAINQQFDYMEEAERQGDGDVAENHFNEGHWYKEEGMKEGCFFTGIA